MTEEQQRRLIEIARQTAKASVEDHEYVVVFCPFCNATLKSYGRTDEATPHDDACPAKLAADLLRELGE